MYVYMYVQRTEAPYDTGVCIYMHACVYIYSLYLHL